MTQEMVSCWRSQVTSCASVRQADVTVRSPCAEPLCSCALFAQLGRRDRGCCAHLAFSALVSKATANSTEAPAPGHAGDPLSRHGRCSKRDTEAYCDSLHAQAYDRGRVFDDELTLLASAGGGGGRWRVDRRRASDGRSRASRSAPCHRRKRNPSWRDRRSANDR